MPAAPPELLSGRVRLEPMRPSHAAEMFAWMRDPALYRFLPQAPPHDVAALAATLRRWTGGAPNPRERWWNWVVRALDVAGEPLVGHVQLTFTLANDVLAAWVFAPIGRGRGLATEATRCALARAAAVAPRAEAVTVAFVDEANAPSIALAERLGLRRVAQSAGAGTIAPGERRFERALADFALDIAPADEAAATIRPAASADLATLRAFNYAMWLDMGTTPELFHDDWERRFDERIARLTRDRGLRAFVAERDGRSVGCAIVNLHETLSPSLFRRENAYVWGVYVRPEARGAGIARRLTTSCLEAARALGCARVSLHASRAGRRTYERLGFRPATEMLLELDGASGS